MLVPGADDIYWMSQLQSALLSRGYYCGEEEMEDWFFGEQTQSAVLTFQVREHTLSGPEMTPQSARWAAVRTAAVRFCQALDS